MKDNNMKKSQTKTKIIKVDQLARVEGEGALFVKIKGDKVLDVKLNIFEPPRFFEAFLRGRDFREAVDITARICGICPVAYAHGAAHAMESICGVKVGGALRELRRLIYCGEWIESHALHVFMLHAPDFLGYEDAIRMAKDHPALVKDALGMKKIGNEIMTLLGGREIHPINERVGGFYKVPAAAELQNLVERLTWGRDKAADAVRWTATLPFPDYEFDYEFVALRHPDEYPFNEGRLVSNKGLDIDISEFSDHIGEEHVLHSTALYSAIRSRGAYLTGPMARYSLNFDKLTPAARELARQAGLGTTCRNPFKSIIIRCVELFYAFEEALRIISLYRMPDQPAVPVKPRAGTGHGCTEAPRGICYHRYTINEQGIIQNAMISPPTAQNQRTIESDLWNVVPKWIDLPKEELSWKCEQTIRNYDPCISCSTHFLKLNLERDGTNV